MSSRKTQIAAVFGIFVIVAIIVAAATSGIGEGSVSGDAVAEIDGDPINKEDFDAALQQAAKRQGLTEVPPADDPQYELIRNEALGDLFDIAWIQGEADDRGVEVSDRQVADQLAQIKQQNFKTEAKYQEFLTQSGFTQEDVDLRVKLQLLSQMIQEGVANDLPDVSDQEVEDFYNENKSQFEQPQSRDIRLVLTKDEATANQAKAALEADPSDANWAKVAKQFSTDPASKDSGGVRSAITQGVLEGEMDSAVFDAPLNQIQGPVQTPLGFYVFEVTKDTPGGTQPLDQIKDQLKQQIEGQKQQEVFSAFIDDYRSKWTELSICADGYKFERCDNFVAGPTTTCTKEQAEQTGCPPPVVGRNPVAPGQAGSLFGASGGAPQRPHPAGGETPTPGGLPGGIPGGGAVPGGAVPTSPTG